MKKFLSLVLALVMTMSLVTIAGAKDFTDDSAITYKEAVDVMSAIEVVDGYTDGSFNPTAVLTRGAAAKIICNMILGPTTADALIADAAPFKDVPADHVFAGYIAYCAQQGIINGYADGTFRPAGTLNGYAFMKMLLGALGYDGATEGFTGANWSIQVAKLAKNLGLDDGNDAFVGSAAVTREEACLYAFNTLTATIVYYTNKTEIVTGDATVTLTGNRYEQSDNGFSYNGWSDSQEYNAEDATLQFCEEYFAKLKLTEGQADSYGRPAQVWKLGKDKIGTYTESPVLTYTAAVKGTTLADDIDDAGCDVKNADKQTSIVMVRNGVEKETLTNVDAILDSTKDVPGMGKGIVVEVYASDDVIDRIVVICTYLAEVTDVVEDKTNTKSVDERALYMGDIVADPDTAGFDEVYEAVEKGDMVLITPKGDNSASDYALDIAVPETVEGVMTFASSSSVKVDGTSYSIGALSSTSYAPSKDTIILFLDANGYVLGYTGKDDSSDKAAGVLKVFAGLDDDGALVSKAKVVFSDGSVETVILADKNGVEAGGLYTYTKKDGKYTLKAVEAAEKIEEGGTYLYTADVTDKTRSVALAGERTYYTSDVQFIFVDGENGKAVVKSGAQKVSDDMAMVINGDGKISVVFVSGKASNVVTDADSLIFIAKATGDLQITHEGDEDPTDYITYDAYIDGAKVEEFYSADEVEAGFFNYELDEDTGAYILKDNGYVDTDEDLKVATMTIASADEIVNDNMMVIDGLDIGLGAAKFADNDTDIDSLADLKVTLKNDLDVEATVLYDAEALEAVYVYITKVA